MQARNAASSNGVSNPARNTPGGLTPHTSMPLWQALLRRPETDRLVSLRQIGSPLGEQRGGEQRGGEQRGGEERRNPLACRAAAAGAVLAGDATRGARTRSYFAGAAAGRRTDQVKIDDIA